MALTRVYHKGDRRIFVRRLNLDDLFSKGIDLKRVLKEPHERAARQKAKGLMTLMLQRMAHDLIEEQSVFVFPRFRFGFVRVAELKPYVDTERYFLDPRHDFQVFGPVVVLNSMIRRVNGGRRYGLKLVRPWMEKIRELRDQGIRWP